MKFKNTGISNEDAFKLIELILNNPKDTIIVSATTEDEYNSKEIQLSSEITQSNKPLDLREKIKLIWQEVLEVNNIKDDDDFFELGGDSLSAIQLVYKIKKNIGKDISPNILLEQSNFAVFFNLFLVK